MRVVCALVALAVLAGCAETPVDDAEDVGTPDAKEDALAGPGGRFVAGLANLTVAAGVPFNVTLAYVDDNVTNASALDWSIRFANATENATFNGTGLPAQFEANLTMLGNVTLTGAARLGEAEVPLEPLAIVVAPDVAVELDPCAGVPAQDPISRSGTIGPGALNNAALANNNNFEVEPCQTKITIKVTTTTGAADIIIRLVLPDGSSQEVDANFVGPETLVYEPGGVIEAGGYNAQVRPYAVVADQYQMTITFG